MQKLRGVATVRIRGGRQEELVNSALGGGLQLWSIRRTSVDELEFSVMLPDFFRLRPYLKRTGCRMHVIGRRGFPFWLDKLGNRKFFAVGMVLFFVGMYLLSSLVWEIEVKGNVKLTEEQILAAARQEGIYPFQWSFRLPDTDVLSKKLTAELPGAAWIGVEKTGTKIVLRVVETTKPEERPLLSPRHLVASSDGVVTQILAEAGRPVVRKNAKVKKGQILISGTIGEGKYTRTVVAKGTVRGLVWHEYDIVSPLTQQTKVYTGESRTKWYIVIAGRSLQVSGFGKNPFAASQTETRLEEASWQTWKLPLGRMKEKVLETEIAERKLSRAEAVEAGLMKAKADVLSKAGADAVVKEQKILHEKTDNGKVYMKVLIEVEQSIVTEMPLVQMQGE
ncbi:sporulation protein [Paenibacillus beijingensis]|uniref:Sporulation protein n=1 Tax=Paenibacillus beijingensis TaxID=1126833 RepID=A0A0D5NRS9_9BACL|nr:sporulation protein [Paenibacillus beijingensis]